MSLHVAIKRLDDLLSLEENWDSYGALPISELAVRNSLGFLIGLQQRGIKTWPDIFPMVEGGITLEWDLEPLFDFSVDFYPEERSVISYYFQVYGEKDTLEVKEDDAEHWMLYEILVVGLSALMDYENESRAEGGGGE